MKLFIFILALTTSSILTAQENTTVLKVTGSSELSVKPTLTVVSMNIQSKESNYSTTVSELIRRVDLLISVLKKMGFKDEDIVTSNFSVNQNLVYEQGQRKLDGYIGLQTLKVSFDQSSDKLLEVLTKTTASQANPEISLSFELDSNRKRKLKAELIKLAVKDARRKADIIAETSDYKISGIQQIVYGVRTYQREELYAAPRESKMLQASLDVEFSNFEASNLTFSDAVEIVFLIDGK